MRIELIILLVYLLGCISIGVYSQRKARNATSHEFLTGGESSGIFVGGMAMFAAFATGGTLLGNMGLSYGFGWGYMAAMNAGVVLGFLLVSFFIAKPFRNMKIATVPEFFKVRYDSQLLRILIPILLICTITAYIVAQMKVAGMIGEQVLGIPYFWAVIIMGCVYIFYTAIGGMWAVTITDVLQGTLMFFIATVAAMLVLGEYGGPVEAYKAAVTIKPDWAQAGKVPLSSYAGAFLIWATCICVTPHTLMRVFAARNARVGRISLGILTLLYTLTCIFTTIFIVSGSVILNNGQNPVGGGDGAFLTVVDKLFSTGLAGLTFAAIFAAVMSSVSAMLLSIAAAASYDLARIINPDITDKATKRLNVGFIFGIGVLVMVLAMNPPPFLTVLYSAAMGLLASCLFWPTILGAWWKRMNKQGCLACMLGSGGVYLVCLFVLDLPMLSQICYSLPVGFVLSVGVSLMTEPPSERELHRIAIAHEREYDEQRDAI